MSCATLHNLKKIPCCVFSWQIKNGYELCVRGYSVPPDLFLSLLLSFLLFIFLSYLSQFSFISLLFSHIRSGSPWILVVGWNWIYVQKQSIITLGCFYIPQNIETDIYYTVLENGNWRGKETVHSTCGLFSIFFQEMDVCPRQRLEDVGQIASVNTKIFWSVSWHLEKIGLS